MAIERDRTRSDKHVAHLFDQMDAEMRANLVDTGWWLDTCSLTVEQTVDALLNEGVSNGEVR